MAAVNATDAAPASVPPAPRGVKLAAAVLLLLSAALALWSARAKSEAYDEPMYILSGYSYVVSGDLSLNREHPPLAKYLIGLPLLLLDLELPPDYQSRPATATAFIAHQAHAHPREILFLARLNGVFLLLLLGLYARAWARLAFGEAAGLLALALVALNPAVIGLSVVAGNDFAVTVFGFAACFHAWRWLSGGARTSLLAAAVLLGCAVGSKFTALVLVPVLGLAILLAALRQRRPALLGWGLLALAAAGGVVWVLYGGEARSLAEARQHPRFVSRSDDARLFDTPLFEDGLPRLFGEDGKIPLLSFLKGLDLQLEHARHGHVNFWRGANSLEGSPDFYAASWLIKNPEAFTLLLLLGLLAWRRTWRGAPHEVLLWLYPLLLFVVFSRADVQLGFKYVLPAVPFLAVAAARWLDAPSGAWPRAPRRELIVAAVVVLLASAAVLLYVGDRGPWRWSHALPWVGALAVAGLCLAARAGADGRVSQAGPAAALLLWAAGGVLARQPHNLVYFNEWVGGPENGTHWSVIGDDWGQDTVLLGQWMAANGVERVRYDYYGTADPEAWGVRYAPTFGHPQTFEPFAGWCAVHVTLLRRFPDTYFFLLGKQPVARLGHTIFLYELSEQDRNDALFQLASRPLPAAPAPPPVEGG